MGVERIGVYPGTFDPVTSGHLEVIRRSMRLVDKLVIGPATNIGKGPLFSLEERIQIIQEDIADFPEADRQRIEVVPFDEDLAVETARLRSLTVQAGLSLADRACLALARRRGVRALTADAAWRRVRLDVDIVLVR